MSTEEQEPPSWFGDLPAWLQTILVAALNYPEGWVTEPYQTPEWVGRWRQASWAGFAFPASLAPSYATTMVTTGMRAGWLPTDMPGYTYAGREFQAGQRAMIYAGYGTPYGQMQAQLYGARAAYWGAQQQWAPVSEAWGAARLASFVFPEFGLIRAYGFPFYGAAQRIAAGAAMSPYVRQAVQVGGEEAIARMMGSVSFWPGQYGAPGAGPGQTILAELIGGVGEWTAAQTLLWGVKAGSLAQTFRQTAFISLTQAGMGLIAPPLATLAVRQMWGIPTTRAEYGEMALQIAAGGTLIGGGILAGTRWGFIPRLGLGAVTTMQTATGFTIQEAVSLQQFFTPSRVLWGQPSGVTGAFLPATEIVGRPQVWVRQAWQEAINYQQEVYGIGRVSRLSLLTRMLGSVIGGQIGFEAAAGLTGWAIQAYGERVGASRERIGMVGNILTPAMGTLGLMLGSYALAEASFLVPYIAPTYIALKATQAFTRPTEAAYTSMMGHFAPGAFELAVPRLPTWREIQPISPTLRYSAVQAAEQQWTALAAQLPAWGPVGTGPALTYYEAMREYATYRAGAPYWSTPAGQYRLTRAWYGAELYGGYWGEPNWMYAPRRGVPATVPGWTLWESGNIRQLAYPWAAGFPYMSYFEEQGLLQQLYPGAGFTAPLPQFRSEWQIMREQAAWTLGEDWTPKGGWSFAYYGYALQTGIPNYGRPTLYDAVTSWERQPAYAPTSWYTKAGMYQTTEGLWIDPTRGVGYYPSLPGGKREIRIPTGAYDPSKPFPEKQMVGTGTYTAGRSAMVVPRYEEAAQLAERRGNTGLAAYYRAVGGVVLGGTSLGTGMGFSWHPRISAIEAQYRTGVLAAQYGYARDVWGQPLTGTPAEIALAKIRRISNDAQYNAVLAMLSRYPESQWSNLPWGALSVYTMEEAAALGLPTGPARGTPDFGNPLLQTEWQLQSVSRRAEEARRRYQAAEAAGAFEGMTAEEARKLGWQIYHEAWATDPRNLPMSEKETYYLEQVTGYGRISSVTGEGGSQAAKGTVYESYVPRQYIGGGTSTSTGDSYSSKVSTAYSNWYRRSDEHPAGVITFQKSNERSEWWTLSETDRTVTGMWVTPDQWQQLYDERVAMYSGYMAWLPELQQMGRALLSATIEGEVMQLGSRGLGDVISELMLRRFQEAV